jgi:hypothetical protein
MVPARGVTDDAAPRRRSERTERRTNAECRTDPMTNLGHPYPTGRGRRLAATLVTEYAVILGVVLLVGLIALAEVAGLLDSFVHSITFLV